MKRRQLPVFKSNLVKGIFRVALALAYFIYSSIGYGQNNSLQVIALGIAQDGGYPQAGCTKVCCQRTKNDPTLIRYVASLAIVDTSMKEYWIIDATPDFPRQLELLNKFVTADFKLAGIILTHAHIGHYTGLMHLGKEVMGAKKVPVFCLLKMRHYLENNGPWSQLVEQHNITLMNLNAEEPTPLNTDISIIPKLVPHRDEYSETAGFVIELGHHKIFYLPDIDKWSKWSVDVREIIKAVDLALLDGCFYDGGELPGRNIQDVPHPFIQESMESFESLTLIQKNKIYFTHLNHTNPVLDKQSKEAGSVQNKGFHILQQGQKFSFLINRK